MQYFFSKDAMRCPDKVTALHLLTHRIVFANAPHCVFSLTAHLPVMLNSFQHLTASLYLPPSLGEILKQVIRLRSSKTSFNFRIRYGQDDY